jgi:adenosylcobinamide-phosphate synthase
MWIGRAIDALEHRAPPPAHRLNLAYGLLSATGLVGLCTGTSLVAGFMTRKLPAPAGLLATAFLLKPAFALEMLCSAADGVQDALSHGDLETARHRLHSLVSRETSDLTAPECAAAAIESLAENMTDSVIGPLLSYCLFGLPGAWAFRTLNTLDSRWGYRGRYNLLGRAAAKLDDFAAFVPARLSAILLFAGTTATGGSPARAALAAFRDHSLTESPNAGWTMAAMAGGLGLRLEKKGHYLLNACGRDCTVDDIQRAKQTILAATTFGLLGVAAAASYWRLRKSIEIDRLPATGRGAAHD